MTQLADILASVGDLGVNRENDVIVVQGLLNSKGFKSGRVDGRCGTKTIEAIKKFQGTFLKEPDGLIEPNRASWRKLTSVTSLPAESSLLEWTGDSSKWTQDKKLASMHPDLRPKVRGMIEALKAGGFQPKIFYGWRSIAVQLELFKKGRSKVKFSFHKVTHKNGTPNAYAADVVDERWAWDAAAAREGYWEAQGTAARAQGLVWGGDWKSFKDVAHVQLVENGQLARLKKESGL
jgi:D-alanyl-D-alanine carboxypeptidase/Putative peptidoglycan binding domain